MAQKTYKEMRDALVEAGFRGIQIPVMIAIGMAESGGNTDSIGDQGQSFGIWQIYQPVWASQFNATCAAELKCSAKAAYAISNKGTNFNPWSVFRFSKFGKEYQSNYANPFTKFLPDVLKSFGIPVDVDIAKELGQAGEGVIDVIVGLPGEIIGDVPGVGDVVDAVTPDIPDWITDPFSVLPSMDDVKGAIVVTSILGIGAVFIIVGAGALARQSDTVKQVVNTAGMVASKGMAQKVMK